MAPDQHISFISYDTIGQVGAEALVDPERFDGVEIELADVYASHIELASALQEASAKPVSVTSVDFDRAVTLGLAPRTAHSHIWLTDVGYPARSEMLGSYGIEPVSLRSWIRRHIGEIRIGDPALA